MQFTGLNGCVCNITILIMDIADTRCIMSVSYMYLLSDKIHTHCPKSMIHGWRHMLIQLSSDMIQDANILNQIQTLGCVLLPGRMASKSYNVSEMELGDNATVHGHILELSPIKKSKNKPGCSYFNGKMSDGVKAARFVAFEPKLHLPFMPLDRLWQEKKSSCSEWLSNCNSKSLFTLLSCLTRSTTLFTLASNSKWLFTVLTWHFSVARGFTTLRDFRINRKRLWLR